MPRSQGGGRSARRSFSIPRGAVPPPTRVSPTTPIKKMLTKQDVLDLVGVSAVTLWSWIRQGIFPPAVVIGPDAVLNVRGLWVNDTGLTPGLTESVASAGMLSWFAPLIEIAPS